MPFETALPCWHKYSRINENGSIGYLREVTLAWWTLPWYNLASLTLLVCIFSKAGYILYKTRGSHLLENVNKLRFLAHYMKSVEGNLGFVTFIY